MGLKRPRFLVVSPFRCFLAVSLFLAISDFQLPTIQRIRQLVFTGISFIVYATSTPLLVRIYRLVSSSYVHTRYCGCTRVLRILHSTVGFKFYATSNRHYYEYVGYPLLMLGKPVDFKFVRPYGYCGCTRVMCHHSLHITRTTRTCCMMSS